MTSVSISLPLLKDEGRRRLNQIKKCPEGQGEPSGRGEDQSGE